MDADYRLVWIWPLDPDVSAMAATAQATQDLAMIAAREHVTITAPRFTITNDNDGWHLVCEAAATRQEPDIDEVAVERACREHAVDPVPILNRDERRAAFDRLSSQVGPNAAGLRLKLSGSTTKRWRERAIA